MIKWIESGAYVNVKYLDLDTCDSLRDGVINDFLIRHGAALNSLNLGGHHRLTENFWMHCFPRVSNIRYGFIYTHTRAIHVLPCTCAGQYAWAFPRIAAPK